MKICGCINSKNSEEAIQVIQKFDPEMYELRMDFLDDLSDVPVLSRIRDSTKKEIIATLRPKSFGGNFSGEEKERLDLLKHAIDLGYDYIDIEIESEIKTEIIEYSQGKSKIIVSSHDFEGTKSYQDLENIMVEIKNLKADIAKIVTTPNNINDCHNVLKLILEAKQYGLQAVAFCMGEIGRFTRIVSLLYGAPFSYASLGNPTASGQFLVDEMKEILNKIK